IHMARKGGRWNEQTPLKFPPADPISWIVHAVGRRLAWSSALVDTSGARSGVDSPDPRQLSSDCANSIGGRRDKGSQRYDSGPKPRQLRGGFLPARNGQRLPRAFRFTADK